MDSKVIDSAVSGHYTDMAKEVKSVLSQKFYDHETVVEYTNALDNIQKAKSSFADMTGEPKE